MAAVFISSREEKRNLHEGCGAVQNEVASGKSVGSQCKRLAAQLAAADPVMGAMWRTSDAFAPFGSSRQLLLTVP
jgi:hypothetical protein